MADVACMRIDATLVVLAACGALVAAGTTLLLLHGTTAGARGATPTMLPPPVATAVGAPAGAPLLLLAAHPQCPCLPATLEQLTAIDGSSPLLRVLVFTPNPPPADWDPAATEYLRRLLPTGSFVADLDGQLALRLGLQTSGHLLLYGNDGTLRFDGGITMGRGHRGGNPAARSLQKALATANGPSTSPRETPDAFGCAIGTDSAPHERDCCSQ
ncbi:MAG: hypothetical protein MUC36_24705 [Planctomycetes bacterium]|jgi:hypothetical protein|nr:hypothetical protein [Planctomycetota bacterium]